MTKLRILSTLTIASALALFGCSKNEEPETSVSEPAPTEGSETAQSFPEQGEDVGEGQAQADGMPGEDHSVDAPTASPPQSGAKGEVTLNDGEILKITEVVNTGEIEQAQLARTKAKSERVKEFAAHMLSEHKEAKQEGAKLVKEEKLMTEETSLATELSTGADRTLQSLRSADPASFDRVYIQSQVDQHQKVLDMLDKQLIPAARNPDVKSELEDSRDMVEEHLKQAREIQQSLTSKGE